MYGNGSDSEPSAMSSPEHVKVKHVKQKNVKKVKTMKCKKEHPKVAYYMSDDEMEVTPKKRIKVKKLRRGPKVKKEAEKRNLKNVARNMNMNIVPMMNIRSQSTMREIGYRVNKNSDRWWTCQC